MSLTADNGGLNANFNNVFANGNGTGIQMTESSQALIANMNMVRANNSAGVGIGIRGNWRIDQYRRDSECCRDEQWFGQSRDWQQSRADCHVNRGNHFEPGQLQR